MSITVYGAGIQTHNLQDMSLLPLPLHQGSHPCFKKCYLYDDNHPVANLINALKTYIKTLASC